MANPLLGQILGSVFSSAMRGRGGSSPRGTPGMGTGMGTGLGGAALGGVLGSLIGRGGALGGRRAGGGGGMLLAMLLPFAMQWVQRNGGIGAVLDRFKQKGYGPHADSWVSTGPNQHLAAEAVDNVVGREELSRLARQFGVPDEEVAHGFAEILPEMVDQLSPEGQVAPEADEALDTGRSELERELSQLTTSAPM